MLAYPAVIAPDRNKSHYLGAFHFVFGLGAAIGPMAGGWLLVELGHAVWIPLAACSLAATLVVLTAVRGTDGEKAVPTTTGGDAEVMSGATAER